MLQEELKNVKKQVDFFLKKFFEEKKKGIGHIDKNVENLIESVADITLRGGDRFRPFMVYLGYLSVFSSPHIIPMSSDAATASSHVSSNFINNVAIASPNNSSISPNVASVSPHVISASSHVIPAKAGIYSSIKQTANKDFLLFENDKNKNGNEKINDKLIKLMSSVELLHTFALIHDDIIDRAKTRRGGPTIKPDEKAILAGDMCFVFADELLNGFTTEIKKQFDLLREEVVAGEWLDVKFARDSWKDPTIKHDISKIHEYKTARYGFLRPFLIGGLSEGIFYEKPIHEILIKIGVAFQLRDDYLDLFGDERLGKQIGGDIREGNLTIFHEKLVEKKNQFDFGRYSKIWHSDKITEEEIKWVRFQIENLRIKKEVEQQMENLVIAVKREIKKIKINPKAKELLSEMAQYVVKREF